MWYEYRCDKCEKVQEIDMPMLEDHPKSVKCECGSNAYRSFGTYKIHIPGSFQMANTDYHNNTASDIDYISGRMKHGTRPSGRSKVVY